MLEKLLGVMSVGSTFASIGLLHRFLSGMAAVVILSIMSAFMLCIVTAGSFATAYFCLVHYGLDPFVAIISLSLIALAIACGLIYMTVTRIRQLKEMPHLRNRQGLPDLGELRDAFLDGFLHPGR